MISRLKRGIVSMHHSLVLACLFSLIAACAARADNWSHWRGPEGNGVAPTANPPIEWSDTKNVQWKVRIPGQGSGSPVVWDNQVFVVSAVPTNRPGNGQLPNFDFKLFCFDRQTGDLRWERTATNATPHEETHSTNNFASASPCTDGEHVYAHFGSRGLFCFTMQGELVWQRDFGDMRARNGFGEGSSPTLIDDMIIVPWDHEGPSALYALNKQTGETIWKTDRDEPTNWSTPLIIDHEGSRQIVMNGQNFARAYDLATGKELWRCSGQTDRPAASAVAGNGLVFVGSGFRGYYLGAFKPSAKGDITNTSAVAWSVNRDTPDIASPLLSSGRLYFYKAKTGLLTCADAETGKIHYSSVRTGLNTTYASPVAAAGRVYLTDREGTTVVIEDAPEYRVLSTNSVGETVDATPAPVDNQLFIRGENHLFCIAES